MVDAVNRNTYSRLLLADVATKQDNIGQLSRQIASGFKHDKFNELAAEGNTEIVLSLKTKVKENSTFQKANTTVINRLNVAAQSVDQLTNIAEDLAVLLAKRRSPSGDELPFATEVTSLLEQVQTALNTSFEGLYLFSGSKTDTQPVLDTVVISSNLGDGNEPNANYYQGDDYIASVQTSRTQNISYGVTASNQAFQDLIGALHASLAADDVSGVPQNSLLEDATELVNAAIDGLVSVNAGIKGTAQRLKDQNESYDSIILLINEKLQNITATDVVDASAKLSENQATLEASLYAFSILMSTNLVDYL